MKWLSFIFIAIAFFSLAMISCGEDDCERISSKGEELVTAATAFNADQSDANCLNYKTVLEEYIEALEGDCNGQDNSAVIETSRLTISSLGC